VSAGAGSGLAGPRHNLPGELSRFVDRDRELSALRRLLLEQRLLTLVGPGGVGKTRLALRLADGVRKQFPNAIWLVDLSLLKEPEMLATTIAHTVGILEESDTDPVEQLISELGSQRVLMVLDNCEDIVESTAILSERLLRSCPHLTLLATSRERLGVSGELVWRVEPMEVPLPGRRYDSEELAQVGAVALFLDRARRSSPAFEVDRQNAELVTDLVRQLEGLPLAIELAAAWTGVLSTEDLFARLSDRFRILTSRQRTMPSRHRSLRAAIDSSYDYLSDPEKRLFRSLGVFAGGWSVESMEAVCELSADDAFELLARLVDRSLVTMQPPAAGSTRYGMLGSLREYAVERLREAGELKPASHAFCAYFLHLAESANKHIYQPAGAGWLAVLDVERDNCRSALETALAEDPASAIRLAAALTSYWDFRGFYTEGRIRLTAAVQAAPEPTAALAESLRGLGTMAWAQGDQRFAIRQARRALSVAGRLGDADGGVRALQQLAQIRFAAGDLAKARARLERAIPIARGLRDPDALGLCFFRLGLVALAERRWEEAEQLLLESIRLGRAADDSERVAVASTFLGRVYLETGRLDQAEATLQESLATGRHHASPRQVARTLIAMAAVAAQRGDGARAAWLAGASAGLLELVGVNLTQPLDSYTDARLQRALEARGSSRSFAAGHAADVRAAIRFALDEKDEQAAAAGAGPRRAGVEGGLTKRQLVVARLVAEGLTNREIAARLYISERTAEGHVEQIRNKLGFSSRSQVAAWAAQNLPPE
jgi:predicted ATPase/DNA-binding CsgD family transcriptional regulator